MGLTHDYGGAARTRCFTASWDVAAKLCDHCHSAPALLFCRVDSAFFCIPCDAKVHHALKHDRVWMCEVCEQAPAAVTCKADAAALCVACDTDIHSANPLARRHERSAVVPFSDTAESMVIKSTAALFAGSDTIAHRKTDAGFSESWLSTDSIITTKFPAPEMKSMEFIFSDSDQFLDFDNYQICSQPNYSDSVVPSVQTAVKPPFSAQLTNQHSPGNRFEIDFTRSNITSCNNSYSTPSLSHSVSSSCVDVGVVPDGSAAMSEIFPSTDLSGSQMDREARVLRYKEKRKNRKFEKTIRYASRKAYAETRPRIKGRFVKRSDSESDINGIFNIVSRSLIGDSSSPQKQLERQIDSQATTFGLNSVSASKFPIKFSHRELKEATDGFRSLLGRGGSGAVYKEILSDALRWR